jgi:hypothetical protein
VLDPAQAAHLLEGSRLEAEDDRIVRQQPLHLLDDPVAAVAPRRLELAHDPDPSGAELDHLDETGLAAARHVVADDGAPVGRRVDVQLDEIRAELDRALESGQGVLGQLRRGTAVRDHPGHRTTRGDYAPRGG